MASDTFFEDDTDQAPEPVETPDADVELVEAPEDYHEGPSDEQLADGVGGPQLISPLQLALFRGEQVDVTPHPLDQGGDSARVWLEDHPEDAADYERLDQTGIVLDESDSTVPEENETN